MDWWEFTLFAREVAIEAGDLLLTYFGRITEYDGKSAPHDLVTRADIESEKLIKDRIRAKFSTHSILCEESKKEDHNSEYCWVVDPLDGTVNFVHEMPVFAVSIGLRYCGNTIAAVVHNPVQGQCFTAARGLGARLNDYVIHPSKTQSLSESLVVTGFPYKHDPMWELSFDIFKEIYRHSQGVRRMGAASLDFCYVASGIFEAYWEFNLKPWDVCAGDLILREAGGRTSNWYGSVMPSDGRRILATNGSRIHEEIETILSDKKYALFQIL